MRDPQCVVSSVKHSLALKGSSALAVIEFDCSQPRAATVLPHGAPRQLVRTQQPVLYEIGPRSSEINRVLKRVGALP